MISHGVCACWLQLGHRKLIITLRAFLLGGLTHPAKTSTICSFTPELLSMFYLKSHGCSGPTSRWPQASVSLQLHSLTLLLSPCCLSPLVAMRMQYLSRGPLVPTCPQATGHVEAVRSSKTFHDYWSLSLSLAGWNDLRGMGFFLSLFWLYMFWLMSLI